MNLDEASTDAPRLGLAEFLYWRFRRLNILPPPHTLTPRHGLAMRLALLALLTVPLCATGCIFSPRFEQLTRLPELVPRHPEIERRAAEFHDPFADSELGPGTGERPLGYHRQRSETRRAAELRGVHLLESSDRLPSTGGMPGRRFSQAVSID